LRTPIRSSTFTVRSLTPRTANPDPLFRCSRRATTRALIPEESRNVTPERSMTTLPAHRASTRLRSGAVVRSMSPVSLSTTPSSSVVMSYRTTPSTGPACADRCYSRCPANYPLVGSDVHIDARGQLTLAGVMPETSEPHPCNFAQVFPQLGEDGCEI